MKKRIILSSIITMLLCFCMIGGATYALFTSETSVNIAVTSGKVKVEAGIENLELYSMDVKQGEFFENGGTAVYEKGVLTLTNVTPGDKVEFDIVVKNTSNIDIQYKVNWVVEGKLSEVLVATANEEDLANVAWTKWSKDAVEKQQTIKVVVELPVEVGNDYQEQTANIKFTVEAVQANGIVKNYATPYTINDILAMAEEGQEIELSAGYYDEIVVPKNGIKLFSQEGAEIGFLNVNGKSDITIEGLIFEAAEAQLTYDKNGNAKQYASIVAATGKNTNVGARNLVIDGCTFTGTFAKGGAAIAFIDQARSTGSSGNITITNCTFDTKGSYYDIYCHYSGYGSFVIEGNTFSSERTAGGPIYLGRYQSSTPVVVKGNTFNATASAEDSFYIQAHSSSYTVSFDAQNNVFKG